MNNGALAKSCSLLFFWYLNFTNINTFCNTETTYGFSYLLPHDLISSVTADRFKIVIFFFFFCICVWLRDGVGGRKMPILGFSERWYCISSQGATGCYIGPWGAWWGHYWALFKHVLDPCKITWLQGCRVLCSVSVLLFLHLQVRSKNSPWP